MARMRTIKPGFFVNEELAEVSPLGRLLFAGLWCIADREGRLEDRPRRIKIEVLPYDECDVDVLLAELDERGFIERYVAGAEGARYIRVVNFAQHQQPHYKEALSVIPGPSGHQDSGVVAAGVPESRRQAIFARDDRACVECGLNEDDGITLSLDHIVPRSSGGTNDDSNLRTLCVSCNSRKRNRTDALWSRHGQSDVSVTSRRRQSRMASSKGGGNSESGTVVGSGIQGMGGGNGDTGAVSSTASDATDAAGRGSAAAPSPVAADANAGDDPAPPAPLVTTTTNTDPDPAPIPALKFKTVYGEESDAMQLARAFARGLREIKPDVKLPRQAEGWQSWAREFDLMLRVDHRPREKIEEVMAYHRRSSFWRGVIFSARTLREKYDRLDQQMQEDAQHERERVPGDRRRAARGYAAGPARGRGSDAGAGSQQRSYPKLDASYYDRVRERERERERERSAAAASGE